MIVKDKQGREIEINIYGTDEDDLQIDYAAYMDSEEEVDDETIEYLLEAYADEIYTEWIENRSSKADYNYGDR